MWVPFPFVDVPRLRLRPAVVVSHAWQAAGFTLQWALMITSADNAGWPDDISLIERFAECGLPAPSVIRPAKVASMDVSRAEAKGRIPGDILDDVLRSVRGKMGLEMDPERLY